MLTLAPMPPLDVALVMLQGEILERLETLIALGGMDLEELEQLAARADEYTVIVESGRIAVCPDTKAKIVETYQRCRQAISSYKEQMRAKAQEIQNENDI